MVDLQKAHKYLYSLRMLLDIQITLYIQNQDKINGCLLRSGYSIHVMLGLLCFIVALRTKESWDWELFEHNIVLYE